MPEAEAGGRAWTANTTGAKTGGEEAARLRSAPARGSKDGAGAGQETGWPPASVGETGGNRLGSAPP